MNAKHFKTILVSSISILFIFVMVLSTASLSFAASTSPFLGTWNGTDLDGSAMTMVIGGKPSGPFNITITDMYITYCGGGAGIQTGKGILNSEDSNILEAVMNLRCFISNAKLNYQFTAVYNSENDTLLVNGSIIWYRANMHSKDCGPVPLGLSAWWPGDGNADDIVHGRNGAFIGDATTGPGLVDQSFILDGDGDFIEVNDDPIFNFAGDFTIDLWVKFNDTSGEQILIEKWIQGEENEQNSKGWTLTKLETQVLRLAMNDGTFEVDVNIDSMVLDIQPNTWYFIAATRQGQSISLYMNGTVIASGDLVEAYSLDSTSSLKFGHRGNPDDTPGSKDERQFYLHGRIDEVEVNNGNALSQDQIFGIYLAGDNGKCKIYYAVRPTIRAHPEWNNVDIWFWPEDKILQLTIDDPATEDNPDVYMEKSSNDKYEGTVWFELMDYDLKPGDIVTVTDGLFTKVLIISNLTIDSIDVNADIVEGSADPGDTVRLPTPGELIVTADDDGHWIANFAPNYDVQYETMMIAEESDNDGDCTSFEKWIPLPIIVASESGDWFWTSNFNPGKLELYIYDSPDDAEPLWSGEQLADEGGFTFVGRDVHGQDLVEGNYLVISDGINTKDIVLLPISVTVFDPENEIMAGYAPADSVVWAAAGPMEWQERLMAMADSETGWWEADFKDVGFDILEEYRGSSFAQIFDEDGDANEGSTPPPPPPAPVFQVFPFDERIEGWNWPENAYVHLTIDDPATGTNPDYEAYKYVEETPWDPSTLWVVFYISPEEYDVKAGDVVVLEDGSTTRTHTVQNLALGWVDVYVDTVTGTADAFADVLVWPHGWSEMLSAADANGDWLAEFEPLGIDLQFGMTLRAEIRDGEGNATTIDRNVFDPHFTIFPEWNWYDAMDWQDGAVVTITVDDKENDCYAEHTSWGNFFNGGFPEECDVVVGDTVRMTDGFTTREHVVQNLAVTGWDVDLDTLTGIADEGTQVVVWPHEHDYAVQTPVADAEDSWTADFSGVPFDLDYYQGGRAIIYGDMGNATAVDWYIRNPHFTIFPEWDWYDAMDWPDGATVTITVDGKEGDCHAEHISWGYFFNGGFPEECDVVIGDTVRMTDGNTTRVHEVQNLAVTGWDVFADTVSGIADEGAELVVWVHEHDESIVYPVANGDGAWTADFACVPFDLDYLMGGRAMIYGEMGNATAVDWGIPESPHMWIWIEWNAVDGHGWGLYEDITLTINYGEHVLIQNTGYGTSLSFDVGAVGHDIVPGDVIVMSNGVVTKTMEVPPLVITGFDFDANTVQGTGDPGLFFFTYVDGQPALAVTWTGDMWVAWFAELSEDQWGDAVQVDGDNDAAAATIFTGGG